MRAKLTRSMAPSRSRSRSRSLALQTIQRTTSNRSNTARGRQDDDEEDEADDKLEKDGNDDESFDSEFHQKTAEQRKHDAIVQLISIQDEYLKSIDRLMEVFTRAHTRYPSLVMAGIQRLARCAPN